MLLQIWDKCSLNILSHIFSIFLKAPPSRALLFFKNFQNELFSVLGNCVSHVFTNIPKSSLVVSILLRQKTCFPYPAKTHSQMHIPLPRILTNMAFYCVHDQQKLAQRQLSSPWYISNYKYGNYSRQSIQRNYLDSLNTTHQLCPGDVSSLYFYLSLDTGNEISLWKFLYSLLQNICENVCDSHDQITSEPLPSIFSPWN